MFIRILVLWLFILVIPIKANSAAKIYVWRNDSGVLVFSDSPKPDAEEVNTKTNQNTMSAVDTSILDVKPKEIEEDYQVEIIQPTHNATVRDNTGSLYVSGRIKPVFKRGYNIQLYVDGKPYEKPQQQAMFLLRDINRGEHQIRMELINNNGKVIASSNSVTFYMHRAFKK